jgi:hypothetical protein
MGRNLVAALLVAAIAAGAMTLARGLSASARRMDHGFVMACGNWTKC